MSPQERAELLDWLWEGLQPSDVLERQQQWIAESEERIDAVDRGGLGTVAGADAMDEARRFLGR